MGNTETWYIHIYIDFRLNGYFNSSLYMFDPPEWWKVAIETWEGLPCKTHGAAPESKSVCTIAQLWSTVCSARPSHCAIIHKGMSPNAIWTKKSSPWCVSRPGHVTTGRFHVLCSLIFMFCFFIFIPLQLEKNKNHFWPMKQEWVPKRLMV